MATDLSKRLGNLQSIQKTDSGVIGKTDTGNFRIRFFSDAVAQVTIIAGDDFEDFSYTVKAQPAASGLTIEENQASLVLQTSALTLTIQRQPVSFQFSNRDGTVLNEDDPGLGTSWIGEQVTAYKRLQDGERFIGLGEKTGPLDRKGNGYQNWNTDAYAYHAGTDPLYCSMPFYIGIHHQVQYGIFLDNSHKTFFNFGASNDRFTSFSADAGEMNYYFISGQSVAEVIRHYTWLTGRTPLPPKWSIGYQQCRYSYYPDKEVVSTAQTFREREIPADAIVLDIHYMDRYKIFTWDKKHFSDPQALIQELRSLGFEIILMCDPGIRTEKGYEAYEDGIRQDVFVKYPDGQNYSGQVWPGWCHFPDFTKPETRTWWLKKLKSYSDLGVEGFWNDMNEPATWGNMIPENLEFDFDGRKATSRKVRNLYGFQMARSTYEAARTLLKGKRPFNLTRSGFSGVQRYSAVWTGDNVSYDEHMMLGIRLVNSMGLTGVSFAGYDIGGFVGEASTKLFARWISIGSFSPFFRGHTMINTRDSEPWSYGEEVEQISRNYIRLRYQLMPYLYSAFFESWQTGMPVQRSLAIDYAHDARVYNTQFHHQYLFGPSILVVPVESTKEFVRVFFPPGDWHCLYDGRKYEGNQEVIVDCPIHMLPVYVKAGAIIPMQKPVQNTKEKVHELILHVYNGNNDNHYEFYEDDGATFDYEQQLYARRIISFLPAARKIILEPQAGGFSSSLEKVKLVLHGFGDLHQVKVNGQQQDCQRETNSFFLPLEKYDPINDPDTMGHEEVRVTRFAYSAQRTEINLP